MAVPPLVESYVRAQASLEAAFAAAPDLPEVHALRGAMALYYYWDLAEASFRRCFELAARERVGPLGVRDLQGGCAVGEQ